jgi:recyclin-1
MDKFATLEPVKLYRRQLGALPVDLHIIVLQHLPIPDFPAYSRCSRSTASLARDDSVWENRWCALHVEEYNLGSVLNCLEQKAQEIAAAALANAPPMLLVDDHFVNLAKTAPIPRNSFRSKYIRAHSLLKQFTDSFSYPPHLFLSALSRSVSPSLTIQAKTLHILSLFLSPRVMPLRHWEQMYLSLRAAMDSFDATLLAAFDLADGKGDEDSMREAAESSWEVWDGSGDWEMGKVWAEKREVFYEQGRWNPMDNLTCVLAQAQLTCSDPSVARVTYSTLMLWTNS